MEDNNVVEETFDIFLSHNWGLDSLDRDNHVRVDRLKEALQNVDVITWFDAEQLHGHISQGMADGIDQSAKVAIFITERYIDKVAQKYGLEDNCRQEYDYSVRRKGIHNLIPIVMEPSCKDLRNWHGSLGATLANQLYIDYSEDDMLENVVDSILTLLNKAKAEKKVVLELENGTYEGTINEEGQPDGNGSMEYKNKNRYEGSWKNGVREGIGQFTPALGDFTYKGEYKNDKKEGEGVLTMKNGDRYEGQYIDDKKEGLGKFYLRDDMGVFEGEYKNGVLIGRGKFTYPDKSTYVGEFRDQKITGRGIRTYLDKSKYDGEWKDGLRHGNGKMVFAEKSIYDGNWGNDRMLGQGVLNFKNGDAYVGNFKNNKMHGLGKYAYITGAVYEGEYSQGKKWGIGKYIFPDGKQFYEGGWENNKMHGKGIRCYQDGSVYEGMFMENTRHGMGKIVFETESIVYQGEWRNDTMHGQGRVNVEDCDSVTVNTKWWQSNPFLSKKIKDVNVTFDEGSITKSASVKRRRRVLRLQKNQYKKDQKSTRNGNAAVPFSIDTKSVFSARDEVLSLASNLENSSM